MPNDTFLSNHHENQQRKGEKQVFFCLLTERTAVISCESESANE